MKSIIIIPAYNPNDKMISIIKDIRNSDVLNLKNNSIIIVVNDGSKDECRNIFEKAEELGAKVISHNTNLGKGAAIKTALIYIKSEIQEDNEILEDSGLSEDSEVSDSKRNIVIIDADGQHKVNDMISVIDKLCLLNTRGENGIVLGCRHFNKKVPFRSRFGNTLTKYVFFASTGKKVSDTQTGLRAFNTDMIPFMLKVDGNRYEYEMDVLFQAAAKGIIIEEVPIECIYIDKNKSSHFRPVRDSMKIYGEIAKFSAASFTSFCIDYLMFVLFSKISGSVIESNVLARIISASFNFFVNQRFVFNSKETLTKSALKYFTLAVFILSVNSAILKLFTSVFGISRYASKIMVEMLMFVLSYLIQKTYIFKAFVKGVDKDVTN